MHDYRLDEVEAPERNPAAVDRLIGRRGRTRVDYSGSEIAGGQVRWSPLGLYMLRLPFTDEKLL